jgi:hypothetical protein
LFLNLNGEACHEVGSMSAYMPLLDEEDEEEDDDEDEPISV